jgi:hypothetical protein
MNSLLCSSSSGSSSSSSSSSTGGTESHEYWQNWAERAEKCRTNLLENTVERRAESHMQMTLICVTRPSRHLRNIEEDEDNWQEWAAAYNKPSSKSLLDDEVDLITQLFMLSV